MRKDGKKSMRDNFDDEKKTFKKVGPQMDKGIAS